MIHSNRLMDYIPSPVTNPRRDMPSGLPFRLTDYLELVDWTGRILRNDKKRRNTRKHAANPPAIEHRPKTLVLLE
jgi:hypothetical protein